MTNEKAMWVLAECILESAYGEGATLFRGQLGLALEISESILCDATGGVFNYTVSLVDGMPAVSPVSGSKRTAIVGVGTHSSINLWKEA